MKGGKRLYSAQYDVKDFFFRLDISEELGRFFGLRRVRTDLLLSLLTPTEVRGSSLQDLVNLEYVHGYFCVLSMGFSWAFYLA